MTEILRFAQNDKLARKFYIAYTKVLPRRIYSGVHGCRNHALHVGHACGMV